MASATTVLVSGDASLIKAVREVVASVGNCRLEICSEIGKAAMHLGTGPVALLLVHLTAGQDESGVTRLLEESVASGSPVAVLVLSDEYCPDQALKLLHRGVADYLGRPLDLARLAFLVDVLTVRARLAPVPVPEADRDGLKSLGEQDPFLYRAGELGQLIAQVQRIAPLDTTVLLGGETGTGKTRLARLVHEFSPRSHEPFLVVDCAVLSASLIESEMFGHVKGAFTGADRDRVGKFAEVGGGTLLLDDIDALPLSLQSKLLRVVEERVFEPVGTNRSIPMRARLIAASSRPLEEEVAAGRFRTDLYYRLNVVGFRLPPLRERRTIVADVAARFMADFTARNGRKVQGISSSALRSLERYHWPGNIRELRNVIERAVALCPGHTIELVDLPDAIRANDRPIPNQPEAAPSFSLARTKIEAETHRITEALEKHGNNRLRAAIELGISRVTLYKKLHKYGIA